jgi:hypothetical protein
MPGSGNVRLAPENLMRAIRTKGLTFHQTAQLARRHLPADARLSHTSVWSYATGRTKPKRLSYVEAIEKAVGVEPEGLSGEMTDESDVDVSDARAGPRDGREHVLAVEDIGDGFAHLDVQVVASWSEALSVLALLCKNARSSR